MWLCVLDYWVGGGSYFVTIYGNDGHILTKVYYS